MEDVLGTPVQTWHYIAYATLLAIGGALGHVLRGFVNPYPDRLSGSPNLDMFLSGGYNLSDRLFGTEYDDYGYYRVDSAKNLRLSVVLFVIFGSFPYFYLEDLPHIIGYWMNSGAEMIYHRIVDRLQNPW